MNLPYVKVMAKSLFTVIGVCMAVEMFLQYYQRTNRGLPITEEHYWTTFFCSHFFKQVGYCYFKLLQAQSWICIAWQYIPDYNTSQSNHILLNDSIIGISLQSILLSIYYDVRRLYFPGGSCKRKGHSLWKNLNKVPVVSTVHSALHSPLDLIVA